MHLPAHVALHNQNHAIESRFCSEEAHKHPNPPGTRKFKARPRGKARGWEPGGTFHPHCGHTGTGCLPPDSHRSKENWVLATESSELSTAAACSQTRFSEPSGSGTHRASFMSASKAITIGALHIMHANRWLANKQSEPKITSGSNRGKEFSALKEGCDPLVGSLRKECGDVGQGSILAQLFTRNYWPRSTGGRRKAAPKARCRAVSSAAGLEQEALSDALLGMEQGWWMLGLGRDLSHLIPCCIHEVS